MPGFQLRLATPADIDAVLAFWLLAAEGTDRADTYAGVATLLERDPASLVLAEDASGIIGSLIAGWDGWRCHLYRLAVRPDRRRQGVGRALLDAAERRFTATGAGRADAMVLDGNDVGGRLWTAVGYRRQPQWSRWVKYLR